MKKQIIAAYAAGIFDGEGYVGIDKVSKSTGSKTIHYAVRIVISQKDGSLMNWLKSNFGGNVYQQRNGTNYSIYRWRIHSRKAQQFLAMIYPYLVIKKEQAKLALEFFDERKERFESQRTDKKTGKFNVISQEELNWRIGMKEKLSKLKKIYALYIGEVPIQEVTN